MFCKLSFIMCSTLKRNLLTRNNFVFSYSHKQSSKNIIKKKCRSWERSCNGVLFLVKFLALEFRTTCFCVSYTIEAGRLVLGQREQSLLSTKLVLPNLSHVAKNLNKVVIYFKALSPWTEQEFCAFSQVFWRKGQA